MGIAVTPLFAYIKCRQIIIQVSNTMAPMIVNNNSYNECSKSANHVADAKSSKATGLVASGEVKLSSVEIMSLEHQYGAHK